MNQTIIQRALGAKNLIEAQKGLLYTGGLKILVPLIIAFPGIIGFYYFGNSFYENQDMIYPCLLYTSPSPRDRQKSRMPSSA